MVKLAKHTVRMYRIVKDMDEGFIDCDPIENITLD